MKDSKTKPEESTWLLYIYMVSHIHWVVPFLLSYILRFVSFAEVGSVCRVALRGKYSCCLNYESRDKLEIPRDKDEVNK